MAAYQEFHVMDNSSMANFRDWVGSIESAYSTFGWLEATDTGQMVLTATVFTLTGITVSGANAIYAYSGTTGPTPRVGMSVTITGFSNGVNNVTATITAIGGGTFTVLKVSQVNETAAASATTTALAAVPGAGTYAYKIWYPGDGLTAFYVKMEYGGSTTNPILRISMSTATNGAGTLTGFVTTLVQILSATNSGAATMECNYSGSTGRIGVMMGRVAANANQTFFFGIERTLDTSGAATSVGASMWCAADFIGNPSGFQATIVFGVGVAPYGGSSGSNLEWTTLRLYNKNTQAFNNNIPMSPVFPVLGYVGNPQTVCAVIATLDMASGAIFDATLYGSTRTFMRGGVHSTYDRVGDAAGTMVMCMRYD